MTDYTELVKALRCCATMTCKGDECKYMILGCHDCFPKLHDDAAAAIEALQAEVERLKDSNEELREKQTFIDHYGTEWMTSAKDVPTAAYEHGYADGKAEERAKMPKRGEWIIHGEPPMLVIECSVCGQKYFNHVMQEKAKYCSMCGAKMGGTE